MKSNDGARYVMLLNMLSIYIVISGAWKLRVEKQNPDMARDGALRAR